jgi:HSP20 family protein
MLMRFEPLREFERLSQQLIGRAGRLDLAMPMDAYRQGDQFVVHFDLPGVDPSSIQLTVEKNVLEVRADRSWERQEGQEWLTAERPQGSFSRQLFLGESLDTDRVEASYRNGVLRITVPVAERAKPRRVEITSDDGSRTIEADTTAA